MNTKVNYYCFDKIKKERWLKGAKTKYDIPQYIEGIPEGFAIFCTTKEAGKVRKYQERIERKNKLKKEKEANEAEKAIKNNEITREVEDMDVINKRLMAGAFNINKKEEKNNKENMDEEKEYEDNDNGNSISDELQEPLPRVEHKYCYICKTKFEKYIKHIKSSTHFENLYRHKNLFVKIKKSFERIIHFWEINGKNINLGNYGRNKKANKNTLLPSMKTEESPRQEKIYQNQKFAIISSFNNKKEGNVNSSRKSKKLYKINKLSNIDLNKKLKFNKKENYYSNKKEIHPSFNGIILNKNGNGEHIINLTINKNINKNIFINNTINDQSIKKEKEFNYKIKTINYININEKEGERSMTTFNDNQIQLYKEERIQPKFVTKSYKKFSTSQFNSITKQKKRKKNDLLKGNDIFVISPKKIDLDYFPILNFESSNKLINKSIILFK